MQRSAAEPGPTGGRACDAGCDVGDRRGGSHALGLREGDPVPELDDLATIKSSRAALHQVVHLGGVASSGLPLHALFQAHRHLPHRSGQHRPAAQRAGAAQHRAETRQHRCVYALRQE
eukprot:scaffold9719_cov116-Isochrysis_galbana.AAC.3